MSLGPEFLKLYQNLAYYTQQGMEKYNDTISKDHFRSSNHRGVSALKQLFLKKHQIQLWTLFNSWPYHQLKTFTAKCSKCDAPTFCARLVKMEGKWKPRCDIINQ